MPTDYSRLTAAPRRALVGGSVVYVAKITPRGWGDLEAFFKDEIESPYERARREIAGMDDDAARAHWTAATLEARTSWPPSLDSPVGSLLLATPEGTAALLWVATHRHTDGMARERAEALAEVATPEEIGRVVALLMPGELGDLKAPGTGDDEGMPY